MLNVNLANDLYLVSDSHEFTIVKRRYNEKKQDYYDQPLSHHGSLQSAIDSFATHRMRSTDASTVKELKQALNHIQEELSRIKKELEIPS